MKIGIIVQARMSSERLPGKVLHPVRGKPMLQYTIERLQQCTKTPELVVATSDQPADAAVLRLCRELEVQCFCGDLENVARRFYDLIEAYGFDAFVRISGDSPLIDQAVVDHAVTLYLEGGHDIVTNILKRTFPKGQSVEVLNAEVFRKAFPEMQDRGDLEHVTRFFYSRPERYRIRNFEADRDLHDIQLSVDTPSDMEKFETLIGSLREPHFRYPYGQILELLRVR